MTYDDNEKDADFSQAGYCTDPQVVSVFNVLNDTVVWPEAVKHENSKLALAEAKAVVESMRMQTYRFALAVSLCSLAVIMVFAGNIGQVLLAWSACVLVSLALGRSKRRDARRAYEVLERKHRKMHGNFLARSGQ